MEKNTSSVIGSRVIGFEPIDWQKLEFLQDDNFKEWINDGDKKLLESLVKYQFIDPFKVWEDGDKLYCLDGKHRFLDLMKAKESGINVPELLPATFIGCSDIKEAAEMVLLYSSAYAKITYEGLFDFTNKFELDNQQVFDCLTLPDINLDKFDGDLLRDFSELNAEFQVNEFTNEITIKLVYPKEEFIEIKQKMDLKMNELNLQTKEELFKKLLFNDDTRV